MNKLKRLFSTRIGKGIASLAVVAFLAVSCTSSSIDDSSMRDTMQMTADYMEAALVAVPYPLAEMKTGGWLERVNIRERLIRFSKINKVSYVYLLAQNGQVISFYPVKGKVSHVASQLTADQMPMHKCHGGTEYCIELANAPMDDGTWGPSEDAIFFFTTDGVYVQWNGYYILMDAPLKVETPPLVTYIVGSEPSSIGETVSPVNGGSGVIPAPQPTQGK